MKQAGQGGIHRHSRRSQEDVDDMMEFIIIKQRGTQ
jgi:hypothetical protein